MVLLVGENGLAFNDRVEVLLLLVLEDELFMVFGVYEGNGDCMDVGDWNVDDDVIFLGFLFKGDTVSVSVVGFVDE